jgi:transposase
MSGDRYDHNDDHSDVTTPVRPRQVEVLSGVERRRKWPDDMKLAIVAEALAEDAVVSEVARRHDLTPSQLFGWIRRFRNEVMEQLSPAEPPMFAPAVVSAEPIPPSAPAETPAAIEISFGAAIVRIRGAVDGRTLAAVLKALRVLA